MRKHAFDYEEFFVLPTMADPVDKAAKERYFQQVAEAKARMVELGFATLLDKKMPKQPPRLRRRVS